MRINKLISAVTAGLSLLAVTASSAFAVGVNNGGEALTDGTFGYELRNGSYTIISCNSDSMIEEIPELRNGYAITAIDDKALSNCSNIKSLKIPDTITSIGDSAFAGCTSLTEITLPKKIKTVSEGMFMGCTNLKKVEIPDAVDTIESYAFYNCSMLEEVVLPGQLATIEPMAFSECSSIENIDASKCTSYIFEDGLLMNKSRTNIVRASTKLTGDMRIPDGITTIEPGSFSVCAGIENLYIPNSVTYIGDDAFGYCVNLKSIDFSEGLEAIAAVAFKSCTALQTLDFPTTLKEIGDGAFYNCMALTRAVIPEGTLTVGEGAFVNCTALSQINIPKSITKIGANAFGYQINAEGAYSPADDCTLSVFSGSAGADYAKDNKLDYSYTDKNIKGIAFAITAVGLILAAVVIAFVLMKKGSKSASLSAKKADKEAKAKEAEENYKSIVDEK